MPFQKIGIDLLGPFRRSTDGKTMIIVCTDYATRYVETGALVNGKATHVARFILDNIISRHGAPQTIVSDQGRTFQSELVQELLRMMGSRSRFTSAYHPATNGLCERFNKTLADMLAMYTNTAQTDWTAYLAQVTFAYNTSLQSTTKFTPFELVYGRHPVLPSEASLAQQSSHIDAEEIRQRALAVRSQAVENIYKKQRVDKRIYDAQHREVNSIGGTRSRFSPP